MKKVLIIGKHSYIGTSFEHYAKAYAPELEITSVSARDGAWRNVDFAGYDVVLHVAAVVHRKEQSGMQQLYREVNTDFPLETAYLAKQNGVQKFVFLSTMAVYGEQKSPIDTNTDTRPVTMYGKSKSEAEKQLRKLADDTFTVVIFRPPMVYGKGCPGNYARLAGLARNTLLFPRVSNQRSMIYIENLCVYLAEAIRKEQRTYSIICPQNAEYVNTSMLVKTIRTAHHKKTWLFPVPQRLIRFLTAQIGIVEKVFGDCYYKKEASAQKYQVCDFAESISRTESGD